MTYFVVARRARAISATTFGGTICAAAAGNRLDATASINGAARQVNARILLSSLPVRFGIRIRMDFPDFCNRVARNLGQPRGLAPRLRARGFVFAEEFTAIDGQVAVDPAHPG